ncbi:two-component system regulatory protein YycI [Ectobacillus sp. JY-23]|uniref:two-component system regulatory protein YycI n=1 Tax=Ectobacillus sp. JY-23 TaxID=2933872 RepID=UPI001FF59A06|nr:two-component system regulatory protein YycI [Ectobacillus sp. JY-23]UOY91351.1 two-component system regulatory protein YycI [Ectobacillus sp. JY-23]
MDWIKIKNIFIITFLILDLFLVYQIFENRNNNQLEQIAVTTLEERLEEDNITYVELPKEPTKAAYITGRRKVFKDEEIRSLKNQYAILESENMIVSKLKEPLPIPKNDKGYFFEEFLRTYVLEGTRYKYWKAEEKERKVYFFQQYKNQNILYNNDAMVVLDYNEKDEITSYTQTMLTNISEMVGSKKDQEIITSVKALEALHSKNELKPGSRVTKVEIGYYTIVTPSSGAQVIAPTWHFMINGKDDFFVNAREGQIFNIGKDNKQWSEEE